MKNYVAKLRIEFSVFYLYQFMCVRAANFNDNIEQMVRETLKVWQQNNNPETCPLG